MYGMRRLVPLVAAIGMACAPAALAADKLHVAVFYDGAFYKSGETVWQGNVFGPKACAKGRRVFIFRVRSGRDQKIGSTRSRRATRTKNFYPFSYSQPGAARSGEYYAKVKPTDACRGARSAVMGGPG
jgi:hypothetical protein